MKKNGLWLLQLQCLIIVKYFINKHNHSRFEVLQSFRIIMLSLKGLRSTPKELTTTHELIFHEFTHFMTFSCSTVKKGMDMHCFVALYQYDHSKVLHMHT